jgi:DNA-binding CsgD family transcriptional regulator
MLLGRGYECELIDGMLDDASAGISNAVLVRGEPGIGKTALLRRAHECALARGYTVLTASGVEAESQIPYAALSDLFRSAPHHEGSATFVPGLSPTPEPAPPPSGREPPGKKPAPVINDRLAVAAATLQELALTSEARPVLCLIDDAHWMDASSIEALIFTARRLQAEGILMLFGVRTGEPGAVRFENVLPHVLDLSGLDASASRELVTRGGGPALHNEVIEQVLATAGGNPLALLELPGALNAEERTGSFPVSSPLPLGPTLERAFAGRIRQLPPTTQRALHILAANDVALPVVVAGALALGGLAFSDLDPAENDGLISIDPTGIGFRHPLMRSAAYQSATKAQRREAHLWLAETMAEQQKVVPQAGERRVWHLLAATISPDDSVADELAAAAKRAADQRGYAIASTLYERSAMLSVDAAARPVRLFEAGLAAIPAGRGEESIRLLGQALDLTESRLERARIEHQICQLQLWRHAPLAARDRLMELAREIVADDRELAAAMVLSAAQASIVMYDQPGVAAAAQAAADLADGEPRLLLAASVIHAFAEAQAGHGRVAAAVLDECRPALGSDNPLAVDQLVLQAGVCNLALERFAEARELLQLAVAKAREFKASGALSMQLPWLALLDLADGRWVNALAEAHEALHLIEEIGWDTYRPTGLSVLARVEAGMGRSECIPHAQSAIDAALGIGAVSLAAHAHAAIGLYHLGTESWGAAADAFEDCLRLAGASAPQMLRVQFLPDAIEACIRSARHTRANDLLAELESAAKLMKRPSTLAMLARCHGLMAPQDPEMYFERSLVDGDVKAAGSAFERARTALYYGEVLRRAKRRSEARIQFTHAYEEFQRLDAAPWAARAAKRLGAAARSDHASLELTPQEVQVAVAVAGGMSNSEAAASLFLSVKTVEYHLGHIFQKLGLRSRTQLLPRLPEIAPEVVLPREPLHTAGRRQPS